MDPFGECRSNVEVFRALAERMGFEEECFRETVDSMIDRALDSPNPWLKGISRDRLEREHRIRLNFGSDNAARPTHRSPGRTKASVHTLAVPLSNLLSPSRRASFRRPAAKPSSSAKLSSVQGLDPVVAFTPPEESRHGLGSKAAGFPLELLARKPDNHLNSSFANLPSVRKMEPGIGDLEMHPHDAKARGSAMVTRFALSTRAAKSCCALELTARCRPEWWPRDSIGHDSAPAAAISMCSPQKNLPTWATRRRSIPSVLK